MGEREAPARSAVCSSSLDIDHDRAMRQGTRDKKEEHLSENRECTTYYETSMWLEEVRSAWVPTQQLMLLIGCTAFSLGSFSANATTSLCSVAVLSHLVVRYEDHSYDKEVRADRAVYWRSLAFQLVLLMCSAVCWALGKAISLMM